MVQDDSANRTKLTKADIDDVYSSNAEMQENHPASGMYLLPIQQLIDNFEDEAFFTTDKNNRILTWNSGAEKLFGYTRQEICGQNATRLFLPENGNSHTFTQEMQSALERGRAKEEKWHVSKTREMFWASCLTFPLRDEEGQVQSFARFVRDLTEKRSYEAELEALLQELEAEKRQLIDIFERAPAFIAILRGETHVFEMANKSYYQLVGHRDIIGKSVIESIPEVENQGYIQLLDTVLVTGTPFVGREMKLGLQPVPDSTIEEHYLNFVYEPLRDIKNNPIGIVAHGYDITDQVVARQKAEQLALQIEQQAKIFDITLTALKDFVYTFDTSGRFTYSNSALLELLGITLDEIIGKNFHDLPYPKELATLLQAQIEQVIVTGEAVTDETLYVNPTGVRGYYEYIFVPVFDNNRQIVLVAGSTRDITLRKQLENQKDDFMGIVSHELKTPVTSIKAFTQVLQNRFALAGDEKSSLLLGKMDAQINKLTSLIEDLLDVTKIEGDKLQFNEDYFFFDELVSEIVEEIQRTTRKQTIEKVGTAGRTIFGDRDRVGQVITNMLTNAIKYASHSEKIIVKTIVDEENVTFCVQDFGIGIPKERQQRIFERFYRVNDDETIPGIGLGLYISAEIIRRQNGKIGVESAEGAGSTFYFSLPVDKTE